MTLTLLDMIGHLSFGLTAFSFYVKDMLLLRALATAAGAVGIVYNYFIPAGPLWLVIFWLCVFMALNLLRIFSLLRERRRVSFTDEERELAQTVFRNFAPVEFMKLLRIAEWRSAEPGEVLARQDEAQPELALIYNGEVRVERDGAEIARGRDGMLIGEMSFIQGSAANATVTTERPTRYLVWPQRGLRALLRRNPTMDVAMQSVFNVDLVRKMSGGDMSIRIREIDHLVLRVVDIAAMMDWYGKVLGCEPVRIREELGLYQLRAGTAMIDLVPVDGELGRKGGAAPGKEARNLDHFCLRIEPFDPDAIFAHLDALGVEHGPVETRFGAEGDGPSIYCTDPEGNTVELKGPPSA